MKALTINIFTLLALVTFSQVKMHQIILQLPEDTTIYQLKSSQTISPFTSYQQLSKSLNIWLNEIPTTQTILITQEKENTRTELQIHSCIKTTQLNQAVLVNFNYWQLDFEPITRKHKHTKFSNVL